MRATPYMLLAALAATACSSVTERLLLEQFFSASRLRDRTALQSIATVVFEPHVNGTVTHFEIVRVGDDQRRTLPDVTTAGQVAGLSLAPPWTPPRPGATTGEVISRDVTIQAPVRQPDGLTVSKRFVFVLQRVIATGEGGRAGRWVVTGFTTAGT